MIRNLKRSIVPTVALLLIGGAAVAAPTSTIVHSVPIEERPDPPSDIGRSLPAEDPAKPEYATTLPPVTTRQMHWLNRLKTVFSAHEDFGGVSLSHDRLEISVQWRGQPPQSLRDQIREARGQGLAAAITPVRYSDVELQREAEKLVWDDLPGTDAVVFAHPDQDNSALVVGLNEKLLNDDQVPPPLPTTFPVEIELTDGLTPAQHRLNDTEPYSGGARIHGPGVICTSGFAVATQGTDGMLTAAHCTDIGDVWTTPVGVYYGTGTRRSIVTDAAMLAGSSYIPAVYWGPYSTNTRVAVHGAASPVEGSEICYSGSFSGTVCGNVVVATDVPYDLGGELDNLRGFRSEQWDGIPAAGQGDSGGPAVLAILDDATGEWVAWAGGIISAIPADSPTGCTGVQGRNCSPTVYSADIGDAANELNVAILVY